jgi:annexin A7/11
MSYQYNQQIYVTQNYPAVSNYDGVADAEALYKSMKGLGTDDKTLSTIISTRSREQLQVVKKAFQSKYGKTLESFIKGDTSGHYQDLLVALIEDRAEYDAKLVREAVKGLGTNDELLVHVVCSRTNGEIKAMAEAYHRLFKTTIEKDVADDTSGDYKNLLLACLRAERPEGAPVNVEEAKKDAAILYKAGEGKVGTDEKVFIDILSHRSFPQLHAINYAYAQTTGHNLEVAVSKETSGNFKRALNTLITPREEYFAKMVHKALSGLGTEDNNLIRALSFLSSNPDLFKAVNAYYIHNFKHNIEADVKGDVSGWYLQTAVSVIKTRCNI